MKIIIIGHGNLGGALARRWADHGHSVIIGTRDGSVDEKATALAQHANIRVMPIADAMPTANVILNATPAAAALDVVRQLGSGAGKLIIDASNTADHPPRPYPTAFDAFVDRTEARVVKAFNSTGAQNVAQPNYLGTAIDTFMAGNDADAKATVRQLAQDAGFGEAYDLGGNDSVLLVEKLASVWITLAYRQGYGPDIALKVLKR